MAILRSNDGQFYNVPDKSLSEMRIPAGQVKAQLTAAAADDLAMQKETEDSVTPHGYGHGRGCWRNCWSRNCWHNCWRNCWH